MTRRELRPDELWALERYGEGWSRAEMAAAGGAGLRGAQAALDAGFRKLGARSRPQAALLLVALRRGVLPEAATQPV